MILEGYLSYKLLGLSQTDLTEITQVILDSEISNSIAVTKTDKKNKNGKVLFVLLKEIGVCEIDVEVPEKLLFEAFDFYKNS